MNQRDSIAKLPFVGESRQAKLKKLGIETVEDLLRFQPRGFLDLRDPAKISQIRDLERGDRVAFLAKIIKLNCTKTPRRGIFVVKAKLDDGTGEINAVWFNQRYLASSLKEGQENLFYGTLSFDFSDKKISLLSPKILPKPDIYITYPQTAGLSSRQISQIIKSAFDAGYELGEYLPDRAIDDFDLMGIKQATQKMHFPKSEDDLLLSKKRFDFENIFCFICQNIIQNNQKNNKKSLKIDWKRDNLNKIISSLPYKLSADQERAILEILDSLKGEHPMNRLLQGDVGSGKTIVAFIASYFVLKAGYKVVYLAPTEILSNQHFASAVNFFGKSGFKVAEVTSKTKADFSEADVIVGTHAVLNRAIDFSKIGLVVIDEQHRFGVEQRSRLIEKSRSHLLSLSATPIPRTIGHLLFGNLEISQIKTRPEGRKKVKTYVIPEEKRNDAYLFVDRLIEKGQQIFIVCPLIESQTEQSDTLFELDEVRSIKKQIEELGETCLAIRRIASLNGKMKSSEKESIMNDFRSGKIDVLVSTSVVEVGIDVPNATAMIVEGADHFGLSQLHQFRGRVGRSNLQSYCFLFSSNLSSENVLARLKYFVRIDDGFELSKIDFKLRGAGKLFGLEQSGFGDFDPSWLDDEDRLKKIYDSASETINNIQNFPELEKKLKNEMLTAHLE